ncbi:MAG: hypothetical protein AUG51_05315 [Acidobacteria bacterium 13_1_20CM_3_53_8]|nr:MAG: hypothetical protein AUG51_05315 [Acidobacteria bacterium 13_1_20CM_3_53_8]
MPRFEEEISKVKYVRKVSRASGAMNLARLFKAGNSSITTSASASRQRRLRETIGNDSIVASATPTKIYTLSRLFKAGLNSLRPLARLIEV